jgi:hypothetical protein
VAYNPPLQVLQFIATKNGDAERGPLVKLCSFDAKLRMVSEGELVWVYGPKRHDLVPLVIDETVPKGGLIVRDIAGIVLTDIVRLVRTNTDRPVLPPNVG